MAGRAYFLEFEEDLLREDFDFSFRSLVHFDEVANYCFEQIGDAIPEFQALNTQLLDVLDREVAEAGSRNQQYTRQLRAAAELIRSTVAISYHLHTEIQAIAGGITIPEVLDNINLRGEQGEFAWTTLFWFWGAWRKDCHAIISELSPILTQWNDWEAPSREAREASLRVLGALCEVRLATRRATSPGNWSRALRDANPEAYEWFREVKIAWINDLSRES